MWQELTDLHFVRELCVRASRLSQQNAGEGFNPQALAHNSRVCTIHYLSTIILFHIML
jgi:hypothetical protein